MTLKNHVRLIFLLTISCVIMLFFMIFITRLVVAIVFYFIRGDFYFLWTDFWYSLKAGFSAGMPLGIGSWFLVKIKTQKEKSSSSKD
ncbi:hypothetical protein EZJ58_3182 [Sodalis ligni]|uniref:Uncharacterized protein n=1 Tax=Sodalis ligni TaxID=2697027 RepID=A0A4V2Q320_9GAMM|nr:hypothetical protein EZJ58_3182 [Sodalis ligni]